jgi:hypothetical protein
MKELLIACGGVIALALSLSAEMLNGTVEVTQPDAYTWSYTVFNTEPSNSVNFIYSFEVEVNAPVQVISSPLNWAFDSDNATYVYWYDTDSAPYPDDIAPGASLGEFVLSSPGSGSALLGDTLDSWDHSLDQAGPSVDGTVLAPAPSLPPSQSPEPDTGLMLSVCLLLLGGWRRKRKRY